MVLKKIIFEYNFNRILKNKIKTDFKKNDYLFFLDELGINNWGKYYNDFFEQRKFQSTNPLTEEEYEFETFNHYVENVSYQINDILREKNNVLFPEVFEKRINTLTESLKKFKLKDDVIVIRRFPKIYFNNKLKKGETFIEKGFISTSLNLSYRLNEHFNYKPINNEVLLLLKVPKGINACYVENINNCKEYELLIQRNQEIKIEQNIKLFNNRIVTGIIVN